jgi:Domain of unknown function (DUF4078)
MPSDQSALYGAPRPKKKLKTSAPDSSSMTFASHLTSLMTAPSKKSSPKPFYSDSDSHSATKPRRDDIFTAHHKAKKEKRETAPADGGDAAEQRHLTAEDLGGVDKDMLHRSKRKMEEKARLYAAMKRGDYVDPYAKRHGSSAMAEAMAEERAPLVDFDRKWAEGGGEDRDTSSEDDNDSDGEELVEYTDEFGRTRKGTRAEAARATRQQRIAAAAKAELDEMRGRPAPSQPEEGGASNIIYGDTVQNAAFNPDQTISEQMAALAAKRDRSLTPPADVHYDASREIRSKGVGFYQFSQDKDSREQEMDSLAAERAETERRGKEREERRQKKAKEMEERRQTLREKKSKKQADTFLRGLELDDFVEDSNKTKDS